MAVADEITVESAGRYLTVKRYDDGEVSFQIKTITKQIGFVVSDPIDKTKIESVLDAR